MKIVVKYALGIMSLSLAVIVMSQAASHRPEAFLKKIQGKPQEGAKIVQHFCAACHADPPQIPLGAPRIGKVPDWTVRMQTGFETLFQHTQAGYGAMPPRGGCFECTDQQLKKAIEALLPQGLFRNKPNKKSLR